MTNLFLLLLAAAVLPPCMVPYFLFRKGRRYSTSFYGIMAVGAQFVLSLPAGFIQAYSLITHIQDKSYVLRLAMPFLSAPFNMGGLTVRTFHELIAGPPTPARSGVASGAISNFHLYLPLLVLQVVLVAAVFAQRFRIVQTFKDPILLLLAGAFLLNSLLNVSWPRRGGSSGRNFGRAHAYGRGAPRDEVGTVFLEQ
jgi:hypothetical protein